MAPRTRIRNGINFSAINPFLEKIAEKLKSYVQDNRFDRHGNESITMITSTLSNSLGKMLTITVSSEETIKITIHTWDLRKEMYAYIIDSIEELKQFKKNHIVIDYGPEIHPLEENIYLVDTGKKRFLVSKESLNNIPENKKSKTCPKYSFLKSLFNTIMRDKICSVSKININTDLLIIEGDNKIEIEHRAPVDTVFECYASTKNF